MAEKIIRDPVHDVIAFDLDRPIDALCFNLIGAAEFQRLRRVHQLGFASLAYPGADHSRYSHSLGVMETARKMLFHLQRHAAIDDGARTICLVACLLHDLGHGPFSHVFERVSGTPHEQLTERIILDPDSQVHAILRAHDPRLPTLVSDFLRAGAPRTFLHDVLSSELDADRFDYLLRDNLMTGSRYGDYDLQWLLHALAPDPAGRRLAVTRKGISAVEAYLQSRYHMYRNVYFHKIVRSAEGMVKLALQRAKRLAVQDRLQWPGDAAVQSALLGRQMTVAEFTDLDDASVIQCFKLWMRSDDAVLAALCRALLFRRLYKTVDISARPPAEIPALISSAQHAVAAAGGDSAYDLFYDEPADTPYVPLPPDPDAPLSPSPGTPGEGRGEGLSPPHPVHAGIPILNPDGSLTDLPAALSPQLLFRRIHVAPPYASSVRAALSP